MKIRQKSALRLVLGKICPQKKVSPSWEHEKVNAFTHTKIYYITSECKMP